MKKSWVIILALAFSLGLALNFYLHPSQQTSQSATSLALINGDNDKTDIFDPADTRIRVIYFGFTRCPDVCPTSLAMLSAAMKQLDDDQLSHIRPIFITLDPERDSGEDAQKYAHYFHPNIQGYSGSAAAIQQLATRYGVIFQKTELKDSELKYTIDHSSYFYFVQPDGTLIKKVPHTLNPQPLILSIQQVEKENA
ncbi:SCO family protein [Vibrio gangliei]|uniref:SCO family protein n=1 Tax=Vibrio gangliei TaxID=2077090 RepID=UPI000D01B638|nr:SCO family protein [Vibrio gangliei]